MLANNVRGALAAALLAVLAIVVAACGQEGTGQTGKSEETLVDSGPNARLSNRELVSVAITNMKALKSYHLEFNGEGDSQQGASRGSLTITLDVSLVHTSTVGLIRYVPGEDDGTGAFLGLNNYLHADGSIEIGVNGSPSGWYESLDGGKTWYDLSGADFSVAFFPLLFAHIWDRGGPGIIKGEALLAGVSLQDGAPRLEMIDGVLTRHMTAEIPELSYEESFQQVDQLRSVELWVSTGATPTIVRMHVEGSTDRRVNTNPLGSAEDAAFSPDGKTLAVAHSPDEGGGVIRLWNVASPGVHPGKLQAQPEHAGFGSVVYSPDGKILAASALVEGPESRIYLWDLAQEPPALTILTTPAMSAAEELAFRPDGKMLAAATDMGGVYVWDIPLKDTAGIHVPGSGNSNVNAVAFSPDSKTLAAAITALEGVSLFDVQHLNAPPRQLPAGTGVDDQPTSLGFSPDGKLLVGTGFGRIRIWELARPQEPPVALKGGEWHGQGVAFTPDNKYLAVTGKENEIALYRTAAIASKGASAQPAVIAAVEAVSSLAFSPDGKLLVAAGREGSVRIWQTAELLGSDLPRAEPTVLVEEGVGEIRVIRGPAHSLTWTWSHFNEDFGEVKPPPTETIKQP